MVFTFSPDEPITSDVVDDFIKRHQVMIPRYEQLYNLYKGKAPIMDMEEKESYKPDNRLVVNFPKYQVDNLNGFFTGIPIKISHDDEDLDSIIDEFERMNNMDDLYAEVSKMTSIYGHAFVYIFQNEKTETRAVKVSPTNAFVVYENTIEQNPLFGVYYTKDLEGNLTGHLHTANESYDLLADETGLVMVETEQEFKGYGKVPLVEFIENEERMSLIAVTESLTNAYNKAVSEKANDVDYFADAYLAILGAELDEDGTHKIRDNRIINLFGTNDASKIIVEFLEKPDGDTSQENLLNRLERLIYQIASVANINDESFGQASGVSLEFKLQPMRNVASMKERKFTTALNKIFEMFFSLPTNVPASKSAEWVNVDYTFTRNLPRNIKEEAEVAQSLAGVTSKETQLKVLSVVDNVQAEMKKIEEEKGSGGFPTNEFGDFPLDEPEEIEGE